MVNLGAKPNQNRMRASPPLAALPHAVSVHIHVWGTYVTCGALFCGSHLSRPNSCGFRFSRKVVHAETNIYSSHKTAFLVPKMDSTGIIISLDCNFDSRALQPVSPTSSGRAMKSSATKTSVLGSAYLIIRDLCSPFDSIN